MFSPPEARRKERRKRERDRKRGKDKGKDETLCEEGEEKSRLEKKEQWGRSGESLGWKKPRNR